MPTLSRRTLLTSSFLASLGLAGCVSGDPDQSLTGSGDGGTLRYAIWSNPNGTFHPLLYFTDYDRAIIFTVYSRLVTLDENQGYQPSLANEYTYSEDGRTLTFTLRDGVTWHDGEPLTADDVAFTYTSGADPDYPSDVHEFTQELVGYEAYHSGESETLEGIEVIDDRTVAFTFEQPYAAALSHFADRPVLAEHVWSQTPVGEWANATELLNNPVGTGPFVFDEFASDQYVSLTRNEDYFDGVPDLERLIFTVSNTETAQTALLGGELDVAELSSWNPADLDTYTDGGAEIIEQVGVGGQYLSLDTRNPKLEDPRVRQAIVCGIDRQGIIDSLLYGHGLVFNTTAHPEDPYYPDGLDEYAYDPDRARSLLAEAGWEDTDGDGVLEKDGEKFTFQLNFPTGNRTREQSAPIIQQNLQELGLDVELVSSDFNSTLAILQDPEQSYDGVLMGGTFRPGQYSNNHWWERYESDTLTELADQFGATVDEEELTRLVGDFLREINAAVVRVWLYIPATGFAVSPTVQDYAPYPYEPFAGAIGWSIDA